MFFCHAFGDSVGSIEAPPLTAPVIDKPKVLSSSTTNRLNQLLKSLYNRGGSQIQVLILDSLSGLTIEEASIQIATQYKLGDKKKDDGVLLVVSIQDRQVRIEVGQGLEGNLTDAYSKRIIDQSIVPYFKSGDIDQGVIQGVLSIIKYTNPEFNIDEYLRVSNGQLPSKIQGNLETSTILKLFILFLVLIIVFSRKSGSRKSGSGFGRGGYYGGGFGGGLRGGGSGWSGGSGGFSGGGASGRW